ncbi:piggyBac transposable element-derived protein 4-like isoform X1 [Ornithodoros turicata]|uniref:piggyBac transposable element-derived protein 4-like isoform X1 n=1 Tax=Ornithodoros turicata TaxID=34597 RepID=UPI003139C9CB
MDKLLMDVYPEEDGDSSSLSIYEGSQDSSSSVSPGTHEVTEWHITDDHPGNREQLTAAGVWEHSVSSPDDPNDSADEYLLSSEDELLQLDPDEYSEDENDFPVQWPAPSTSNRKAFKQYARKKKLPTQSEDPQLDPKGGDSTVMAPAHGTWNRNMAPAHNNHGPTCSRRLNERSTALDAFTLYFDTHGMQHIVEQTNLYALQKYKRGWEPLTNDELRAYIGMLILISINPMHQLQMYWSSDSFFHVKEITRVMTYKRFQMITTCLHLNDNAKMSQRGKEGFDCAYKVRPLIKMMNERFQAEYSPSSHLAVDECLILLNGHSSMMQYRRMKQKIKRGYKVWSLADSQTGYLIKFQLYEGRSDEGPLDRASGEHVVLTLADGAIPAGSQLFLGNSFTSTRLLQELHDRDILACGMFRAEKTNLPEEAQGDNKLDRGSYLWRREGHVVDFYLKHSQNVHIMSNYHGPESRVQVQQTLPNGKKKAVECPAVVKDYSTWMGGVDKFDRIRSAYVTGLRSERWWSRIFYFILDAAVVNSYV